MDALPSAPAIVGLPRLFLHLEGTALLLLATGLYYWGGSPWWV